MSRSSGAEWAKRVERWKDSGLSAKEYAAQTGLNASTLANWHWKLSRVAGSGGDSSDPSAAGGGVRRRKGGRAERVRAARFVEVPNVAVTTSGAVAVATATIELVLSRGIRVRVSAGFDETTLSRVVRAVEAAP